MPCIISTSLVLFYWTCIRINRKQPWEKDNTNEFQVKIESITFFKWLFQEFSSGRCCGQVSAFGKNNKSFWYMLDSDFLTIKTGILEITKYDIQQEAVSCKHNYQTIPKAIRIRQQEYTGEALLVPVGTVCSWLGVYLYA